jgi:hypothetical protein
VPAYVSPIVLVGSVALLSGFCLGLLLGPYFWGERSKAARLKRENGHLNDVATLQQQQLDQIWAALTEAIGPRPRLAASCPHHGRGGNGEVESDFAMRADHSTST